MDLNDTFVQILRHDLHKVRVPDALGHRVAMPNGRAREADGIAAWLSRNFLRESFSEEQLYRKSLLFPASNLKNPRALVNQHKSEVARLFQEGDAVRLHRVILSSKLLNLYCEAKHYPYTSLKYHILLTIALYFNLNQNYQLGELYLCENLPVTSPLQIIYQDAERTWAILPRRKEDGLMRVYARFNISWERRRKLIFGGEYQVFAGILSSISSWSAALSVVEEFRELADLC